MSRNCHPSCWREEINVRRVHTEYFWDPLSRTGEKIETIGDSLLESSDMNALHVPIALSYAI